MNKYRDEAQDKNISELLRETDCVPDAPDCRAAVMARIARPKPVPRYRWAYAGGFAALVVAAIGIAPFLTHSADRDTIAYSPTAKHSAPAMTAKPETKLYAQVPKAILPEKARRSVRHLVHKKPVMLAMAGPITSRKVARGFDMPKADSDVVSYRYHASDPHALGDTPKSAAATPAANAPSVAVAMNYSASHSDVKNKSEVVNSVGGIMADRMAATPTERGTTADKFFTNNDSSLAPSRPVAESRVASAPTTGRAYKAAAPSGGTSSVGMPLAVAMVTWPSNGLPKDSYDYAYTSRDTATGNTTECRVKRSGNSVEIYLESKPAITEPPVKGSLDHEAVPNA